MSEALWIGIGGLLLFFTVATFLFTRIKADIVPEEYEFQLDPCWYMLGLFFVASIAVYYLFPPYYDMVKAYGCADFAVPVILAALLYFFHLLGVDWLTWSFTFAAALGVSFMQPDDFVLFPAYLSPLQDKFAVAAIITLISFGLGLLNGIAALASLQFVTVMLTVALLAYFGIVPQLLGAVALAYMGIMLAFAFLSWPPEKLIMSQGAFAVAGFIMGCFMLNGAVEFSESSMFIASAYLAVEVGIAAYNRFIKNEHYEYAFMYTLYYKLSQDGIFEQETVIGVLKLLFINILMALIQTVAHDRLALPAFCAAIDLWYLSILSGDTKPEELLSFSKWGTNVIKKVVKKRKDGKKNNSSANNTPDE